MKKFLLYTLATITGIFVASILFFFVVVGSLSVIIASGEKSVSVKENSLLVINTGTIIPDRTDSDPFAGFDYLNMTFSSPIGLNDIIENLKKAANDPKICGVLVESGNSTNGWATTSEVRSALRQFRESSGKFIIAYSEGQIDQKSYYLASVADEVYINPTTNVLFGGISGQVLFYKRALEMVGVDVQVLRHGKFKGAVEPYMLDSMSEENREQIMDYTGSIWESVIGDISVSRNISTVLLDKYADNLAAYMAQGALDCGLVDGLLYRDGFMSLLRDNMKIGENEDINRITIHDYSRSPSAGKSLSKDKIAVIYAVGDIVTRNNSNNIEAARYADVIRKVRNDSSVKAIVIRVNSPGGEATAADIIWKEVELASKEKPVVVSMGDYAASGGYYISAPATKIFADPVTITGSIGVFGLIPNGKKLLEEKLGISVETVKTNDNSAFPSLFEPLSPLETQMLLQSIENVYDNFIDRVSRGRGMTYEEVDLIGQGRVWSGTSAHSLGLVDEIGGLEDAIAEAGVLANLEEYSIKELPEIEDSYTKLMKQLGGEIRLSIVKKELGRGFEIFERVLNFNGFEGIQVRLPYIIELN